MVIPRMGRRWCTNGKIIRLLVVDERFDVRYGELRGHERVLGLRAGVLRGVAEWVSPTRRLVRVSSTRVVLFTQRSIAAMVYEVEPLEDAVQVVVQSELVSNETLPVTEQDARAAALGSSLVSDMFFGQGLEAILVHATRSSGLIVGARRWIIGSTDPRIPEPRWRAAPISLG
jgi:alpha,alpha-trehalose phosphorylase